MLLLNAGGTHYSKKNIPSSKIAPLPDLNKAPVQKVGRPYDGSEAKFARDDKDYRFVHVRNPESDRGWYLAGEDGTLVYRVGIPIKRAPDEKMDNDERRLPISFKRAATATLRTSSSRRASCAANSSGA